MRNTVNKVNMQFTRIASARKTAVTIDTAPLYRNTRIPIEEIFYSIPRIYHFPENNNNRYYSLLGFLQRMDKCDNENRK